MDWSRLVESGDLLIGVAILATTSFLLFLLGYRLSLRMSPTITGIVAAAVLVTAICFMILCHGRLAMAAVVPLPNAIVLGNWIPLMGGFFSGILMRPSLCLSLAGH